MKAITVVLPALKVPGDVIENKIIPIATAWPALFRIVVHADSRALSRRYFAADDEAPDASDHYRKSVENWCDELKLALEKSLVNHELSIIWGRKITGMLDVPVREKSELYVVYSAQKNITQEYRWLISHIEQSMLILFDKPWHSPLSVAAAIDPIHEDDDPALKDIEIIQTAKRFSRALSGSLTILHSCFVPPYLLSYKQKITSIHRDNVNTFLEENDFSKLPLTVIYGEPSITIPQYVHDKKVDILTMGSIARGFLERYILGSTAEDICSNAPCDLLLIRS